MRPANWMHWGLKAIQGRKPSCGLVFHHVPKCAGTSVRRALIRCYRPDTVITIASHPTYNAAAFLGGTDDEDALWARIHRLRQELLFYDLSGNAQFVGGHIHYCPKIKKRFAATHQFITVLRDPVERFISQYVYSSSRGAHDKIDAPLDAALVEAKAAAWGACMVRFFCGLSYSVDPTSRTAIDAAKENIDDLSLVGFLDAMDAFRKDVSVLIGTSVTIAAVNTSPNDSRVRYMADDSLMELINEACAPDIELYEHARRTRDK